MIHLPWFDLQFGMESAFTGDISLHLGLVDSIDSGPCEGPAYNDCPERVSLQWVWVKTIWEETENKFKLFTKHYWKLP